MIRRVHDINGRLAQERRFWNRFAGRYDLFVRFAGLPYGRIKELIFEDLCKNDNVFEAASGTGDVTVAVAERVNNVIGQDIAPEMVKVAEKRAAEKGLENVVFSVGDTYDTGRKDAEFDLVLAVNFLHVLIEPEQVMKEFKRILKPGGRLIAPTYCHGESLRSKIISRVMGLSGFNAYNRWSIEGFKDFLEANGFEVKKSIIIRGGIPLEYALAVKS